MMAVDDPVRIARWVAGGGLLLGLLLGMVAQSTRFCVRGALADFHATQAPGRLLSWLVAIAAGAVGVQALIALGVFDASRTLAWSDRLPWASALVGGALFGFGMMLGAGCPQRHLVKAGAGDLKALVTMVVTAIAAAMTLRGAFAELRVQALDRWSVPLATPQDAGSLAAGLLPVAPGAIRAAIVVLLVALVAALAWRWRGRYTRAHWLGGLGVGLLLPGAFALTGGFGFLPEHPETLEPAWLGTQTRRPEGLSFSAPLAHALDLLTLWTDKANVVTFGVTVALGVLVGSHVTARLRGEWALQSFTHPRELLLHLAGGVLMGFGGITALGCSVGNGVTGVAMLSAGAALAVVGIVAGGTLALRLGLNHEAVARRLSAGTA